MSTQTIQDSLRERFSAPLPEFHKRRVIFWHDEDQEFASMLDELELPGVKLVKLTGRNNFAVKKLLLHDDPEGDYLVYDPCTYAKSQDNWLIDIELSGEEFRADLLSMRMQELGMPATVPLRKAMKEYGKFFENKERVAKLVAFKSDYSSANQLHIDILAVLAGTTDNTPGGVIRGVLSAGLDVELNNAVLNIQKFGSLDRLWELIERYAGYQYDSKLTLIPLAGQLLLTTLSATMGTIPNLETMVSPKHQQFCVSLINDWLNSDENNALYEIAREVETEYGLPERLEKLDINTLMDSECFPCINECILQVYMTEISNDIIHSEEIIKTVERRRTLKWYKPMQYYFDGLLQAAKMQQFYQANVGGFHFAKYEELWAAYCNEYCKMDHFYRRFHTAFGKALKESVTVLDDGFKNVADYVERLYKNWYLAALGAQWTALVKDELSQNARLVGIRQQENFYDDFIEPGLANSSRMYVIISDALRYEVGVELTGQLIRETKGTAKISSMQAIFPSITKFGMAALLPHKQLTLAENLQVLCDGNSTEGTANRGKILAGIHQGNVATTYKSLLAMKQAERYETVRDAQVVYIYHNVIDTVGENLATEDQVFSACDQAISEIKNLIRIIVNDMNGTNIVVTSDHGFLYSYKPLEEYDKADRHFLSGEILELDRRYVLTDGDCSAEYMLRISLDHLDSRIRAFTPMNYIRMKAPGGMNYVHGGVSLQELVVPVIEFKNVRSSSKKFVAVEKVKLQLLTQRRKVSNSIFHLDFYQTKAVGGKTTEATYEIYMADASGTPVSDKQVLIADRTSPDDTDRVFRARFTLKSMEFNKNKPYYLMIMEQDTSNIIEKIQFTIDIVFTNDFDF